MNDLVVRRLVGREKDELAAAEHLVDDARLDRLVLKDGEVKPAVVELLDELGLVARIEVDARPGILRGVRGNERGQQLHTVGQAHANAERGVEVLVDGGELRGERALHVLHVAREAQHRLAGAGERDARRRAIEELRAELLLDVGDLLGQTRTRHVEPVGCLREALGFRKYKEHFDIVE